MARYKVVPVGEASLHTLLNGQEIELKLPEGGAYTPMMKLLAACMLRAEEDLGWWEDMVAWADRQNSESRAEVKRKQIRLVSSSAKAKKPLTPEEQRRNLVDLMGTKDVLNTTKLWLRAIGFGDLADDITNGQKTPIEAFDEANKRRGE